MRSSTACLCLTLSSLATASIFGGSQKILDEKLAVPGKNPLEFCQETDAYTLTISKVDLTPNPPKPGETLEISAKGIFTEEVKKGAYIDISVKYGLIKLLSQKADLCEQMKNVDEECPLIGEKTIKKEVDLPKQIPPGQYTVLADVYTKDDKQITCLTAHVTF